MNRFDVALKRKDILVCVTNKDIDMGGYEKIGEDVYKLKTTQSLKTNDLIVIDQDDLVIKALESHLNIGYVIDPVNVLLREQNRNTLIVGNVEGGSPSKGFLHDHPGLQRRLGVDNKHVIVDKNHWIRAKHALMGKGCELIIKKNVL
jgi:hypothetical protein